MTEEKLKFQRVLNSINLVTEPGKYTCKVTSVHLFGDKYIVNLNVMNMYNRAEAVELYKAGEYVEAANKAQSFNVWIDEETGEVRGFLPQKGEYVNIIMDYVTLKTGEEALLVVSVSEIKAKKTRKLDIESIIDDIDDVDDDDTDSVEFGTKNEPLEKEEIEESIKSG